MFISLKDCMLNVVFQMDHVVVMIGGLVWGRVIECTFENARKFSDIAVKQQL